MFIRTKDDVYDTEKLIYRRIEGNKLYRVGWDVEKPTFEADIINQSDNLAELCDEFVIVPTGRSVSYMKPKLWTYDFKKLVSNYLKSKKLCDIYGAIWTDKGLIYVAKMNENGELVLI